jgi:purine-nucleoside phosphorylase
LGSRPSRAADAIRRRTKFRPVAAAVLGSGLGGAVDIEGTRIPYRALPGWPRPTVAGHEGTLVVGRSWALLKGRAHYYEGYSLEEVVFPIRAMAALGVRAVVLTASVGALRPSLKPGTIVAVRDHLNLMGANPLRGAPSFVSMSDAYDARLRAIAALPEAVYVAMPGPSYETPAEVRMARALGGDVVGMSTVPEAIAAREAGMRVLALALVTNAGAGLAKGPLSHAEVVREAGRARARMGALLRRLLPAVAQEIAGRARP